MACALGVAACNAFKTVRYVRLPELLDTLCIAKGETWAKMRKRYIACDLLIVDDWLLETISPSQTREVLEIVEARHRKGSLILCSQFAPSGWRAKLGDNARDAHRGHRIHEEEDVRHNLARRPRKSSD